MAQRLIICAAEGRSQANRIVGHLINGGFPEDAVSVLFADNKKGTTRGKKHAGGSMMTKACIGTLLGGAFVWLSGMGTLSVPNLGSLIIVGAPLVTAMGQLGGGSVADALVGMGLSKNEAGFYEAKVVDGNILISVNVSGNLEALAASRVIRAIGVQDVADTAKEEAMRAHAGNIGSEQLVMECGVACQ